MTLAWLFYIGGVEKVGKMLLFTANNFFMLNKLSRFSVFVVMKLLGLFNQHDIVISKEFNIFNDHLFVVHKKGTRYF